MNPVFIRLSYAAAFMLGRRDGGAETVSHEDVANFVASLDAEGVEELRQFAEQFEFRAGAVWLGDIRLTPVSETYN
jgi:hypothetical protein